MLAQTTTHATLLARVSAGKDPHAWREFCDRYEALIRGFALRRGVFGADADDIVQDVLVGLTRAMPAFAYDPAKGKFRSYLKTAVIRAIAAKFRQNPASGRIETLDGRSDPGTPIASTNAPSPPHDSSNPADEAHWEAEWRQHHLRHAMKIVRTQSSDTDLAAFEAYAIAGQDASAVAHDLGLTLDQVYQAKSRIMKRLSEQIARQVEEEG